MAGIATAEKQSSRVRVHKSRPSSYITRLAERMLRVDNQDGESYFKAVLEVHVKLPKM